MTVSATDTAVDIDDYEDTGLYYFMGPLAELPGLEPDDPEPSAAEHAHHIEFTRRRDWADSELWRAEREAERDRRIAEFRTMRDAWAKRPANDNRPAPSGRFSLTWFGDIAPNAVKRTFIKGVFGEGEFTTISGLPGSGKSAITTDAACHVAAGMPWQGRPVRQGLVVFIAAERKTLTERRMLAFKKRHGVGNIPLLVLGGMIDMTSTNVDARAIAATIKQAEVECGQSCVWIIVDTLTRTFGPGDQNASKDMGRYVQNCDLIRETVGAHLTTIHHTAWTGERGKGAIDLDGAVDASFLVKSKVGSYELICDGANDGEEGTICKFRMESVTVGTSEDGEPTTAPVIVPDDSKEAAETFIGTVKGHSATALTTLKLICRDHEEVTEAQWREAFYAAYPDDSPDTLRKRFQRVRRDLMDSEAVIDNGGTFIAGHAGQAGHVPPLSRPANAHGQQRDSGTGRDSSLELSRCPAPEPGGEVDQERGLDPDEGLEGDVEKAPDIGVAEAYHPSPNRLEGDGEASGIIPEAGPSAPDRSDDLTDDDIPAFMKRGR